MTKLNKILFYSDFISYSNNGDSITGATYFKNKKGPTLRGFENILKEMVDAGLIKIKPRKIWDFIQKRPVPVKPYSSEIFTQEEIKVIDDVIEHLKGKSATEVSDLSHEFIGYKIVRRNEDIPYCTAFCQEQKPVELPQSTIKMAIEISKRYDLPLESS